MSAIARALSPAKAKHNESQIRGWTRRLTRLLMQDKVIIAQRTLCRENAISVTTSTSRR
jgi:hypothetical protein